MRYFWKACQIPVASPLMTEIMRTREVLFPDGAMQASRMPPDAKRLALGVMQVTNSTALLNCDLFWLPHNQKIIFAKASDNQNYVAVLSGQIMCMVGDECPPMNAGDVYWVDSRDDAIVLNKSGDDAIVLLVTVKPE